MHAPHAPPRPRRPGHSVDGGVGFRTGDGARELTVLVTDKALEDSAAPSARNLPRFEAFRTTYAKIANAKFDAGAFEADGKLMVRKNDIPPGGF